MQKRTCRAMTRCKPERPSKDPAGQGRFLLGQRNLLYTAVTRSRKLVVLVGTLKALAIAVRNMDARRRVTLLKQRLQSAGGGPALPG